MGGGDWFAPLGKDEVEARSRVEAQKGELRTEFVERFGPQSSGVGSATVLQSLAGRVAQNHRVNELVLTFVAVRRLFESLPAMAWPSEPLTARSVEEYREVLFPMNYWVRDSDGKGRISFDPDPVRHEFMAALAGVEIERIRRCPIDDCGKFFYARPAHKGACDEHVARARVQRGRDPERRQQYERTRRINRLVRMGKPLNEAKTEVERKRRKQRKGR